MTSAPSPPQVGALTRAAAICTGARAPRRSTRRTGAALRPTAPDAIADSRPRPMAMAVPASDDQLDYVEPGPCRPGGDGRPAPAARRRSMTTSARHQRDGHRRSTAGSPAPRSRGARARRPATAVPRRRAPRGSPSATARNTPPCDPGQPVGPMVRVGTAWRCDADGHVPRITSARARNTPVDPSQPGPSTHPNVPGEAAQPRGTHASSAQAGCSSSAR